MLLIAMAATKLPNVYHWHIVCTLYTVQSDPIIYNYIQFVLNKQQQFSLAIYTFAY